MLKRPNQLKRSHLMARVSRALSGLGQREFEKACGVPNIGHIETGWYEPTPAQLAAMCKVSNRSLLDLEKLLIQHESGQSITSSLRPAPQEWGIGSGRYTGTSLKQFQAWAQQAAIRGEELRQSQRGAEMEIARSQFENLKALQHEGRKAVIAAQPFWLTWALIVTCGEWSVVQLVKDRCEAREWSELSCLISHRVHGPAGLKMRVQGLSTGFLANVDRACGALARSEVGFIAASALWNAGEDPDGVIDPGRLLELEASLRKDQRRPCLAHDLLERAALVTRRPIHVLLKRGLVHAVQGQYEKAIEILKEVGPEVENLGIPRLKNVQRFNLAANLCQVGRHAEAAELFPEISELARQEGEMDVIRTGWLEGRIAAGLGNKELAVAALENAAQRFEDKGMHYQVALALLEASTVHLEMGRTDEVKRIAGGLAGVFASQGVDVEALAALRLFSEAVATGTANVGSVQRILQFLFRAWRDESVKFQP